MTHVRLNSLFSAAVIICSTLGWAHADEASRTINDDEIIVIDSTTFKITTGKAAGGAAAQVRALGARELGPGALILRSGDKLFIANAPSQRPADAARGAVSAGADTAKSWRPDRIRIEYVPPKKAELQEIYRHTKEERALEIVQQLLSPFRLPEDLTIRTRECGFVNAWFRYEDTGPAINLCYEYLQEIMDNAPSAEEMGSAGATRMDALIGQFFYLVAHEFGHAVFHFYNAPLFGSQEDAADRFAAYLLLWFEKERARKLIVGAKYSYRKILDIYRTKPKVSPPLSAYSSAHGLPQQRFFNMMCMAYGADSKEFAFLIGANYLPESRAKRCGYEFATLMDAMHQVIRPHIDHDLARKVFSSRWIEMLTLGGTRTSQRPR